MNPVRRSSVVLCLSAASAIAALAPANLRTEWLPNPLGIDAEKPRVSWRVEESDANVRGQKQTAYRVIVASRAEFLEKGEGDLWDSGKVTSDETLNIEYTGRPLASGQACFWKVKVWDKDSVESAWSAPAQWSMGLLKPEDWKAQWISFKDDMPLHADRAKLYLPPARHYRKEFAAAKEVKRAALYGSALGLVEFHLNGKRVGDAYFEPGWADYRQRVHYRVHDVTKLLRKDANCLGAIIADGWYAGYVGYGLLVGYGPNKCGRAIYGKTPALLAQLDIEYTDGSHEIVGTDSTWQTSGDGPIREADLLMGESHDSRIDASGFAQVWNPNGLQACEGWKWQPAIRAEGNGSTKAKFFDTLGEREVELGFQKPARLVAYTAPPIRITEQLPAKKITEPKPGTYIFDLGQNIAGIIRLKLRGATGTRIQIRYGEMLHKDGTLMTENLRKARATDFYTLRGDANGETWQPRFTYHGFQFVEFTGLAEKPALDAVTGLVLNNDTPMVGEFACSDPVMTQFWKNTVRTQKANFIEIPTDCPQRDERLGWMGDAQIYAASACYNADCAAFFTKWIDDVREAQRPSGAYPDYAPYPFAHGTPGATHAAAWTDAGIIVPYTMWRVYGDRRLIEKHWDSMVQFMDWRAKADPELKGVKVGNTWGDWLNVNEETPIEFVDLCYHHRSALLMMIMADAFSKRGDVDRFKETTDKLRQSFRKQFLKPDGGLSVNSQSAYALALESSVFADSEVDRAQASRLAEMIAKNDFRMSTGFLGTKPLLQVLTYNDQHDLACRLFQSRKFPSWGYEVEQGATSVWERWDSFTKQHGFDGATGKNNAAMNSFNHYAFGAVMQWAFEKLAGIDTGYGVAFKGIPICPNIPSAASNPDGQPLDWVRASYEHPRGRIVSAWKRERGKLVFDFTIPANTTAGIRLPARTAESLESRPMVKDITFSYGVAAVVVGSGNYHFEVVEK